MKVLLCVDRDLRYEDLLSSFRWCVTLGEADRVVVAHVVASLRWMPLRGEDDAGWAGTERAILERVDDFLSETASRVAKLGAETETLRLEGDVGAELLEAANRVDADLIIIGALGQARSRDFLVGSAAEKLASHGVRDVLMVRPRISDTPHRFNALLAVDGSEASLHAVESFATKTRADAATIRVVHVLEIPPATWYGERREPGEGDPSVPPFVKRRADEAIERAKSILAGHGLEADVELRRGTAAGEILVSASDHAADLVVVASRGWGTGRIEAWGGTVAKRVTRHAAGSVWIACPASEGE